MQLDSEGEDLPRINDASFPNWPGPRIRTWFVAYALSIFWTGVYFLVFFLTTFLLNLTTEALTLISVLWFSVLAEANIRWLENSQFVFNFTNPAKNEWPGSQGYTASAMLTLQVCGTLVFFLVMLFAFRTGQSFDPNGIDAIIPGVFYGQQGNNSLEGIVKMFNN
ncbi:MAG: hypothetical protein GKR91_05990 [Pseudomonadales bacterium]|nr:hypothetical protein [Pseudomonadales bacterium]